jgi:hypothetical protein
LGKLSLKGSINKMHLKETESEELAWIQLAENRSQWLALVNIVMNLRVPQNVCNS